MNIVSKNETGLSLYDPHLHTLRIAGGTILMNEDYSDYETARYNLYKAIRDGRIPLAKSWLETLRNFYKLRRLDFPTVVCPAIEDALARISNLLDNQKEITARVR